VGTDTLDILPKFHVIHDFLDQKDLGNLLEMAISRETDFHHATVSKGPDEAVQLDKRSARKLEGGLGELKPVFHKRVSEVLPVLFEKTGVLAAEVARIELELAAHNDGDFFKPHIDTLTGESGRSKGLSSTRRLLSGVFYFYQEPRRFCGGELRIHSFGSSGTPGRYVDIIPEQNMFVSFPSFAMHEVLLVRCESKSFDASRFSVNCWVHRST
jgi:SM-20-related protein